MEDYNSIDERLDRYLHAEMTKEEEHAFEQELSSNEELRAELRVSLRIMEELRQEGRQHDLAIIAEAKKTATPTPMLPPTPPINGGSASPLLSYILWMIVVITALILLFF